MQSIRDIDTSTYQGKVFLATLGRLTSLDKYACMHPDECLQEMCALADDIYKD